MPQSREVEGAGESICKAEPKHGRNPTTSILKGKASVIHLVLFDLSAAQMVDAALRVDFGLIVTGSRRIGGLGTLENVEIVVCSVAARVSFSSNGSPCLIH